jgi:hypothetical protein
LIVANQIELQRAIAGKPAKIWTGKQTKTIWLGVVEPKLENAEELVKAKRKADKDSMRNFICTCGLILTRPRARMFIYCPFCHEKYVFTGRN